MPIGIVGATLIAAGVGAAASVYAASTQANAAKNALQQQQAQYTQSRGDITGNLATANAALQPYSNLGTGAIGSIAQLYGFPNPVTGAAGTGTPDYSAFTNSPDYNFALQQGTLAVDRSAAARGLLNSGGNLKDLTSFGQGLASQQYGNYFNRLAAIAGLGQTAATAQANAAIGAGTNLANLSQSFGTNSANTIQNIGAAQASGAVGIANALSTLPQNLLYAQYFGSGQSSSGYAPNRGNALVGSTPSVPSVPTSAPYGNVGISPYAGYNPNNS